MRNIELSISFLPIFTVIFGLFLVIGFFKYMNVTEGMTSVTQPDSTATYTTKYNY